jgi:hypothetical protein
MTDLAGRIVSVVYAVGLLGFLLLQGLRGMTRLRAVVDYLDLREARYPGAKTWERTPLPRQATLPPGPLAVVIAGVAWSPLVIAVALGGSLWWRAAVAVIGSAGAVALAIMARRDVWAATRQAVFEAASSAGEVRDDLFEEALAADPQVRCEGQAAAKA